MILKKTYYSISEVSKMLNIQEHTIRFWDSKLPHLSKRDNKGKTRFFNLKQIEKISKLRDILKKNDSITLAYEILSKNNSKKLLLNLDDSAEKKNDSNLNQLKVNKIRAISNNLKNLIN
ncbi:MerR family transcriptional regulator [Pelagibacteraceae bacterium]|nr:MerR family transcriptional regulator [Pelagibacteraceae bacterium]